MTSAVVAVSITAGAGAAFAVPEQGGTDPTDTAPSQGGINPGDQAPDDSVAYIAGPGPGTIPGPPVEAPYRAYTPPQSQSYEQPYTPLITNQVAPRVAPPVRPIAPPENKIRVGNFVTDIPEGLSQRDVNSINAWSAYGEAKIAQGLLSIGVPEDEATRRAAATIIGVMGGGTIGAATLGIPAAVVGAAVGAGVGAVIGWHVPPTPLHTGSGALIGAAVGGIGAGAVAGAIGFAIGGTAGGALAYALGAGDPGANPAEPWRQNGPRHASPDADGPNQFEFHLGPEEARRSGLPAVDYVVNGQGDVEAKFGATKLAWTGAQARAPYAVFGPQAEEAVRNWTRTQSDALKKAIPGSDVLWPAEAATGTSGDA